MSKVVQSKDYVLTIRVKFGALDDVEARRHAQAILADAPDELEQQTKLQEVYPDRPPRSVHLATGN